MSYITRGRKDDDFNFMEFFGYKGDRNMNNRPWTTDSDNTSGDDGNKFYLADYANGDSYVFNNRKDVESYIERNYGEDDAQDLDVFYGLKRHIETQGGNFTVKVY